MITFKDNYIYHMSGRSPKVAGSTLLHAVNNYWYDYSDSGHAFEVASGANVLVEGSVFQNVPVELEASSFTGQMLTEPASACSTYLGRTCQSNIFGSSGTLSETSSGFLSNFEGKNIASADAASSSMETTIPANAGNVL